MIEIETYNDQPNFSVVVPAQCNMHCAFCSNPDVSDREGSEWLECLGRLIWELPPKFSQVSVTGGEPLLFSHFHELMGMLRKRFAKVIVSTNGTGFAEKLGDLSLANDVNVSYHGLTDAEAARNFGVADVPEVRSADVRRLAASHTGVTRNAVILANNNLCAQAVTRYVDEAKERGYTAVAFRYDMREPGGLDMAWIPSFKADVLSDSACPVCRTIRLDMDGFPVFFKASVIETDGLGEGKAYELIYRHDGILSRRWDGADPIEWEGSKTMTTEETKRLDRIERMMKDILSRLDGPAVVRDTKPRRRERDGYGARDPGGCYGWGSGGHC